MAITLPFIPALTFFAGQDEWGKGKRERGGGPRGEEEGEGKWGTNGKGKGGGVEMEMEAMGYLGFASDWNT